MPPAAKKKKRRSQTERREATRRQLLDAAIDILFEKGFNSATLVAVAKRAGVTRGAVQHHFGNKDDLVVAVIDEISTRLPVDIGAEVSLERSVAERVQAITDHYWRVINSRTFVAAMKIQLATVDDPPVHARIREGLHGTEAALDRQWVGLFGDQKFDPAAAVAARHVVLASMRGFALRQIYRTKTQNWDRERALLRDMIERVLTSSPARART
jgi:AcrR family transcriptional regulator